ncbi:lipid-A-disaccharide synthase [Acuticoccus mangrovi]|uniref:Lipid-A-disaccharide synthase n=1 Tax=Acuticoccus mangrovi TaxID=2796142 RepID=A0A934IMX1_9HYPH|nr:lipid-A-disaccharide synthase [Acuticoccus mangrovi]MBJ3775550.1 lipid-A-disaccharide synthase [Acuticoccus mangrovi]
MRRLRVAILAGEASGDHLGGALMHAIAARRAVEWMGVGGEDMMAAGLDPIFPLDEISVMGIDAIVRRLPQLLSRIREAAERVVAFAPDVVVIIDAPEFNHRVAKRVRKALPGVPIVNYVSPTIWAWRPGRAKAMRPYVDLVLALFPFEPEAHARLGGPRCVYVGHPLYEATAATVPPGETLLVLPGSRRGEIDRLMPVFGAAIGRLAPALPVELLAVPWQRKRIEAHLADWPVQPAIVSGPGAKAQAFAKARAALAASGTVTLELAAARVPMVVAYKLDFAYRQVKRLHWLLPIVKAPSMVLANIAIGRNDIPAFLEEDANPEALAAALAPLLKPESEARALQMRAFDDFAAEMAVATSPAEQAADAVLSVLPPSAAEDSGSGATGA